MDLIASFNSNKISYFHFFTLSGLSKSRNIVFLFDTGAVCPVIGTNNFFTKEKSPDNIKKKELFEKTIQEELKIQNILPRSNSLKAANNQEVKTYPCICRDVSISSTGKMDFFFDLSFDEISIPLLGSSFIDDCSYSHSIGGNLNITGIREKAGSGFYDGMNILNFNTILDRFEADSVS